MDKFLRLKGSPDLAASLTESGISAVTYYKADRKTVRNGFRQWSHRFFLFAAPEGLRHPRDGRPCRASCHSGLRRRLQVLAVIKTLKKLGKTDEDIVDFVAEEFQVTPDYVRDLMKEWPNPLLEKVKTQAPSVPAGA